MRQENLFRTIVYNPWPKSWTAPIVVKCITCTALCEKEQRVVEIFMRMKRVEILTLIAALYLPI